MSALKLGLASVRRLPSTIAGHAAQKMLEAMDTLPAFGPSQFSIFGDEAMDTQPYTWHSQFSIFSTIDMDTAPAMGHGQFSIFAKGFSVH